MRLFTAVRPPDAVLDHLARALASVGVAPTGSAGTGPIRWTASENWHLTLAFYGDVPDGAVDELAGSVQDVALSTDPFTLRLRGAGVFSHRTVWVGAADEPDVMAALSARARDAGAGVSTWRDERVRSRPHLTVGRVVPAHRPRGSRSRRQPAEDVTAAPVRALSVYEGPAWQVQELLLLRSQPGAGRGGGPLYTEVGRFALGTGATGDAGHHAGDDGDAPWQGTGADAAG